MQESKKIGPIPACGRQVTTREELDDLYKNIQKSVSEKEDTGLLEDQGE